MFTLGSGRRRAFLLVLAFAFPAGAAPAQKTPIELIRGQEAAANRVIVRFRSTSPALLDQVRSAHDVDCIRGVGGAGALLIHSRSKSTAALVRELRLRPDVLCAEPDFVVHATETATNDPRFGEQWGLKNTGQPVGGLLGTAGADVKATAAWDVSTGNRNAVVAMIDTGIDYTHPDLAANVWSAPTAFSVNVGGQVINCRQGSHGFNAILMNDDPMDDAGHGTHTSGIVGAVGNNGIGVSGVNWTASILACKFLGPGASGFMSDAINAMEFAIQVKIVFGAQANVRVLSNSWGGYYSDADVQALSDEVARAYSYDMLFVVAAGNNHSNVDLAIFYPAHLNAPNQITVAATDPKDALATFSNYGSSVVHLGAPGILVLSTIPGGGYDSLNGTSMACPFVSGAAALILSVAPSLTTDQLRGYLLNYVDADPSLAGITSTGGRLNVDKAIRAAATGLDFTVAADPLTRSGLPGSSSSYGVTVTPTNGFGGTVTFSVDGLPTGASAAFAPVSLDGSGTTTLTVTTPLSAVSGNYPLTIHAVSGIWSRTAAVTLVVTDFGVSVETPAPVARGASISCAVTLTPVNGFDGPVSFEVTGLPKHATSGFSPATVAGSGQSTLTITTQKSTPKGTFSLTLTATSGGVTHSTPMTLTVSNK